MINILEAQRAGLFGQGKILSNVIDMTGILTLEDVITALKKRGVRVILCDANARVKGKLVKAGILDLVGDGNYAETLALALSRCRRSPGYDAHSSIQRNVERRHERLYRVTTRRFLRTSQRYFFGEKEP